MILDVRLNRLERLMRFRLRLIRFFGSLEAARENENFVNVELLITTITDRIKESLLPTGSGDPLTAGEIIFINFLLNNLREL